MLTPSRSRPGLVLFLCLLAPLGCSGPKGTDVTGTLIFPSGFVVKPDDAVSLNFVPEGEGEDSKHYLGVVNAADKTFVAKGVPAGKYSLTCMPVS